MRDEIARRVEALVAELDGRFAPGQRTPNDEFGR
jgi:hypothetical protein